MNAGGPAGALLLVAAATVLMGIVTAEALYPSLASPYTTHANEISDLGAPQPPEVRDYQLAARSAAVFNGAMLLAGTSIAVAGYILAFRLGGAGYTLVGATLLVHGVATCGVGLFPSDQRALHLVAAIATFTTGGIAALLASRVQAPPSSYASAALGLVILTALVLTGLGPRTPLYEALGPGGIERWIAYPTVLWLAAFGGYLMGLAR